MLKRLFVLGFIVSVTGCFVDTDSADNQFGTQNFVSAISMIELHKVRNGVYPENLQQLEFLGDWDGIWLSAVRYEKVSKGYNLYVERGWVGTPTLEFPPEFKRGLGIQDTNVKWQTHSQQ